MNWFWRSIVLLLTIFFIYLLFPIFIVPSKLPAVAGPEADDYVSIYQVEAERVLTLKDRWQELKRRHETGMSIIRQRLR